MELAEPIVITKHHLLEQVYSKRDWTCIPLDKCQINETHLIYDSNERGIKPISIPLHQCEFVKYDNGTVLVKSVKVPWIYIFGRR